MVKKNDFSNIKVTVGPEPTKPKPGEGNKKFCTSKIEYIFCRTRSQSQIINK